MTGLDSAHLDRKIHTCRCLRNWVWLCWDTPLDLEQLSREEWKTPRSGKITYIVKVIIAAFVALFHQKIDAIKPIFRIFPFLNVIINGSPSNFLGELLNGGPPNVSRIWFVIFNPCCCSGGCFVQGIYFNIAEQKKREHQWKHRQNHRRRLQKRLQRRRLKKKPRHRRQLKHQLRNHHLRLQKKLQHRQRKHHRQGNHRRRLQKKVLRKQVLLSYYKIISTYRLTSESPEPPKPSKSNLVMEKRTSTMSRVRLQEPGDVAPEGEKEIKPEGEKRKSDGGERKKSDARTSLSTRGSIRGSLRGSTAIEGSKEGILRRRSDRPSKSKMAVGSIVSIRRTSGYGEYSGGGKVPKYMNSYKLDSDNPFQVERVEKILKEVLTEALEDLTYDTDKCPKQAKWASSAIRARVKEQEYDRYRFVVLVTIGEKRYHDMCCMVRFLWDIERDKYAIFVHENMTVFATALCFGIYYE